MKKIYLFLLVALFANFTFAEPITKEQAQKTAIQFFSHYSKKKTSPVIKEIFENTTNGISTYYTFVFENGGWAIIAADNIFTPVLAWSEQGYLSPEKMNPSAKIYLESINNSMLQILANKSQNKLPNPEWKEINAAQYKYYGAPVSPLVKTLWDQTKYYNVLCPSDLAAGSYYGNRVPTGCVATTMSQIMKYHSYPAQGVGTHSYTHSKYGFQSANYGTTTYNWTNMPYIPTSENNDIATIMYHAGVSVNMNYAPDGSGAYSEDVVSAMTNYFNYDPSIKILSKSDYTDEMWRTILKLELDASRPVYYAGSGKGGGHAWVCDGYDNSATTKFHFNWGWGGNSDGYFLIGALNPGTNTFNDANRIIVGIKPRTNAGLICRITSPEDRFSVDLGTDVLIKAETIKGTPTKIRIFIDGILTDSTTTTTLNYTLKTTGLTAGTHSAKIEAVQGDSKDYHTIYFGLKANNWIKQTFTTTEDSVTIEQISIVNSNVIWAKARSFADKETHPRTFIRSTDGGATWTSGVINFTRAENFDIANIVAIDANKAYACMLPLDPTGGKIVVTTDGGVTWTEQTSANFTNSWANWVHFFDASKGVCQGDSYNNAFFVFTTSDGGNTWTKVIASKLPAATANEAGTVNFYDANGSTIWFGTNTGRVYKSDDYGNTWTVSNTGIGNAQTNVKFRDANNGYAFGSATNVPFTIANTTDGGATWKIFTPKGTFRGGNLDYVPGSNNIWINVNGSGSSISFDDGKSYFSNDFGNFQSVEFLNSTVGFAGGVFTKKGGSGSIYKWNGSLTPATNFESGIIVKDIQGNVVVGATVELNYQTIITGADGKAVFQIKGTGNPENFKITKDGYTTKTGMVAVSSGSVSTIILEPAHKITFVAKDQTNPVAGVTINMNGTTKQTDANGVAEFLSLPRGLECIYIATKTNYNGTFGSSLIVDKDITINLSITAITGINQVKYESLNIYPNPTKGIITVRGQKAGLIEVYNIQGQMLFTTFSTEEEKTIDLTSFDNGIYFIKLITGDKIYSQKINLVK